MAEFRLNPIRLLRRYVKAHHFSRAALVASGILAALLFFAVGAGVRLLIGPVSLGPFAGSLADAIDRALPGIAVKYDQAAIEWERDEGRVNLVILGTRVFDRSGRIIAQAPKADIDLAAGPFLHGKIDVKRIVLVGVQLTLVRTEDGGVRLGIAKDHDEEDILKKISDALKANNGNTSSLESFAVRRARLAFYDESTKLFIVAPRADFRLARAGENLAAKVDADIEISGRPAHLEADIAFPKNKGRITGTASITGLSLRSLAVNSQAFAAVKDTALKLDLTGRFRIDGPRLVSAQFDMTGKGAITVPGLKDGQVRVSSLHAYARYDGVKRDLVLDRASIDSDKVRANLKGQLGFEVGESGELSGVRGELHLSRLAFAWPGVFAQPVQFQSVEFNGSWTRADQEFRIDRLAVNGAPASMQATGHITLAGNLSPEVDVSGTIAALKVRDLVHYWPVGAASGAREWVDANMPAGTIGPTSFELHFAPGMLDQSALPSGAISVKFAVAGAEISYIKGLTHLTEVQGTAAVTGTSFTADVPSAKIGPLSVHGTHFVIPDFNTAVETGTITGRIQGAMPDVLALVDMPPLGYPTRFGINAASSKGDTALDLTIRVPMQKSVLVDDIGIGIKAVVTGFALALGPHMQLTDGNVDFTIDNNHLHATGTSGIGGSTSRLNLDWTEDFKTARATTTRVSLKGVVDDTARSALNLGAKDYLKGPIGISGTLVGHRGSLAQANLTLDLTPTNVTVDLIGVNKPAGFPMTARLTTAFGPASTIQTQAIRITGPGTSVTASAHFEPGGHLVQLQAPTVRIGPQNDFALNVTRGTYGIDVLIHGRSLDGSRIGRHGSSSGDDEKFDEPFHINAKLDKLVLRDGVSMSNYTLDVTGVADRLATANLTANLSKTSTVSMTVGPSDGGRRLAMSTNDLGMLLQGLFGFGSIKGGKLDVAATFSGHADQPAPTGSDAPDFQGKATLKEFRVLNQPFLARLFTAGSLLGLANLLQGEGIEVDSLDVPFSSRNGVISVHDVRASGPAIGVSADGYVDRPKNAIALKGSLVPLFGLNSVLGNIPLLGTVITSKEGEGIIGMTYSVSGNADEPSVSVNPLSALAPGILRRIFEGRMPNAAQAPSNAPKPSTTAPSAPAKPPAKPKQ
jgi:AsmA-like C-terminal region/Protein of unknown function